jgi:hypothetical protein
MPIVDRFNFAPPSVFMLNSKKSLYFVRPLGHSNQSREKGRRVDPKIKTVDGVPHMRWQLRVIW